MKQIPIYNATISMEEDSILCMSLVDIPATERDVMLFKKEIDEKAFMNFEIQDDEKRLASGVVMLADTPIYRRKGDFEYYVTYSRETLGQMAEKFLKTGYFTNVDLQHNGELVEGVNLVELYIKDSAKGINPNFVEDIPDGSLMATYKVENDEVWESLKSGELNGFSMAGLFTLEQTDKVIEKYNKENKKKLTMTKLKERLKALLMEFASIATDKGEIFYEGELAVGVEVHNDADEPLADGEYATEDKIIVVAEGKITEIRDKEEEKTEEKPEESAELVEFKSHKEQFEATYNDIFAAIQAAVAAVEPNCYVLDAAEDFAIVSIWNETDGEKLYKYAISIADGVVTLGERVEVKIKNEYVPVDAPIDAPVEEEKTEEFADEEEKPAESGSTEETSEIDALKADIEALKAEIAAIKDSVAAISNEPATKPVAEEFEAVVKTKSFGDPKLNNLMRIVGAN